MADVIRKWTVRILRGKQVEELGTVEAPNLREASRHREVNGNKRLEFRLRKGLVRGLEKRRC
jgi:hypothetical protein